MSLHLYTMSDFMLPFVLATQFTQFVMESSNQIKCLIQVRSVEQQSGKFPFMFSISNISGRYIISHNVLMMWF